jgi:endonuclease/exonuclease/phosphatase family metal-dependent hydrolase
MAVALFSGKMRAQADPPQAVVFSMPKTNYEQAKVRLLSHNIFWFQGHPFESDQPLAPRAEIMDRLAKLYVENNIDILCLQEVQSADAAKSFAEKLGDLGKHYLYTPGGRLPQYGGAIFSRWPLQPLPIAEAGYQPERILLGATVQLPDGRSLRVANLHLPSNRQLGVRGGEVRLSEAAKAAGKADVIVGDFNMAPPEYLRTHGYLDVADACGANNLVTQLYNYRGDQVWLAKNMKERLRGYIFIPREKLNITHKESDKTLLSDHWPVGLLLN